MANNASGAQSGRKLGVGIIGLGWVAGEHIKAYQQNPHCEVVALSSSSRENAEAVQARHGLAEANVYT
ncbi:MAG TPA: Gfo/Idh/MocA family oxidoreductase, partial [Chloroflexota bacterium]|nr:Gfo/Idh/MocA family oxidoreductase [Chloroflexota bacterium]